MRARSLVFLGTLAFGVVFHIHALAQSAPPLIPREAFFGNPAKVYGELSPDGHWLSWEAPKDGVLNVFVAPLSERSNARALTAEKTRPVSYYWWSSDSRTVLYTTDNGGDENYQLFGVDVATGARRALTNFRKTNVGVIATSYSVRDRLLIGANNRDPRYFDVLSLDLKSGALTQVFRNDAGFASFFADDSLAVRLAVLNKPSGDVAYYHITGGKADEEPFEVVPFEDASNTAPVGYPYDGKTLYWLDSRGRDTAALVAQDTATGTKTVLGSDGRADIGGTLFGPRTGKLQAYGVDYEKLEWKALDPAIAGDLDFLKQQLKGEIQITSRTWSDDKWTVDETAGDVPGSAWLYDRKAHTIERLYTTRPELESVTLAPMHPVEIKARDGLTLTSYLTLPIEAAPGGATRPAHPVPLVIRVHGGPWGRVYYAYDPVDQWLANRGYAVLWVNFRGSTGFGKRFVNAGDHEWGAKMLDDLIDAKAWAVEQGVTTPDRVAVAGGSYGGYATLAALAFRPNAFACGSDLDGPSNLDTALRSENTPAYWATILPNMYRRVGDPTTPEGEELLKARSPFFAAGAIRKPLLIGQGTNDPRVMQAQSDQIVDALKAKNIPVTYLLFSDEGHGLARPENDLAYFAVEEQFFAKCLGGRAEPIGRAFNGSTLKVEAGAEEIPGLREALEAK
jgi:dipeptidyl aminopeptidase/acylaminoacyl peptidase